MRILIAAGGTGGHLFPAIRLAEEIKNRRLGGILFATSSRRQDRHILQEKGLAFATIPVIGLQSKKMSHTLNFIFWLIVGTIKSLYILLRFRPSVIIGFGGYVSGPILLLASFLRIKTIIHEQNVCPGRTNRLLARFVNRIMLSFPDSVKYLKKFEQKIIISGNPVRLGLKKNQVVGNGRGAIKGGFKILVIGGSQGAHTLNTLIPEAVHLMQADKKSQLELIHIAGGEEKSEVIRSYNDMGVKNKVLSFTLDIDRFYNECDFVIGRSGATTVSELLYTRKPSILIPYPHANGHQRLNAKVLEDIGVSVLLDEGVLTPVALRDTIIKLMDRNLLNEMSNRVRENFDIDPCDILMKEFAT